jgi:sterol desaturase/sphingolipid hydroxylase (fatty acid hydroxylase superfamily)
VLDLLSLAAVYAGLAVVAPVLAWMQRRSPAVAPFPALARTRATDWLYWLLTPIGTGTLTRAVTYGTVGTIALASGHGLLPGGLLAAVRARSAIGQLPLAAQMALALIVADLVGYWTHRLRHAAPLWPFHAIHHSARALDWLAAARMHPIDDLLDNVVVGAVVLLLGFDAAVFAALGPTLIVYTLFLHANVRTDLGALRYVLASPAYHRWHHAADPHAMHRNFAEMFPVIDVLFGTFYFPRDRRPDTFGVPDARIPDGVGGQLGYPIRHLLRRT